MGVGEIITAVVAGYAAVVATITLVLNRRDRRKARTTDVRVTYSFKVFEPDSDYFEVTVIATNHGETEEHVEVMGLNTWGHRQYFYGRVSVAEEVGRDLLPRRNVKRTFKTANLPPVPIGPLFVGYAVLAIGQMVESEVAAFSDSGAGDPALSNLIADLGPITEAPPDDGDSDTGEPRYVSGH